MLFVGTEKGGIFRKARIGGGFRGANAAIHHFLCQKETLDGHVLPNGGTRSTAEQTV